MAFAYQPDRRDVDGIASRDEVPDLRCFEGRVAPSPPIEGRDDLVVWRACNVTASRVALLDLDRFKRVDDSYGHAVGDAVLRAVSELLCTDQPATDVIGRLGGDEFDLMVRGADVAHGRQLAERLRAGLAALEIPTEQGVLRVTGSPEVTGVLPQDRAPEDAFMPADHVMYAAKRMGRDRVVAEAVA